uniref:Uncharacterized protein n=1 Tax=Anguilla anguilla TaxID=7936 RepID=A0A0E9Q1A1_ANGAN
MEACNELWALKLRERQTNRQTERQTDRCPQLTKLILP